MSEFSLGWRYLLQDKVMLASEAAGTAQHAKPSELSVAIYQDMRIKMIGIIFSGQPDINMYLFTHNRLSRYLDNEGIPLLIFVEAEQNRPDHMNWSIYDGFCLDHNTDNLILYAILSKLYL